MIFAAIFVATIWSVFIILTCISVLMCGDKWIRVYDDCDAYDFNYQYIFRMTYSRSKEGFNWDSAVISVQVFDRKNKNVLEINITPKAVNSSVPTDKGDQMVRIVIYRKEPIRDINKIVVNHNSRGTVYILTAEIQNMTDSMANVAFINKNIGNLNPSRALTEQAFPAVNRQTRVIESAPKSTFALNVYDYSVFIWMAINLVMVMSVGFIICMSKKSLKFMCSTYNGDYISSLLTGVTASAISSIVFIALMLIHRFVVKEHLMRFQYVFNIFFLVLVIICGLVAGVGSPFLVLQLSGKDTEEEVFWIISSLIGLFAFIVFCMPLMAFFGYLIGFFKDPVLSIIEDEMEKNGIKSPSVRTVSAKNSMKSVKGVNAFKPKTPQKTIKEQKQMKSQMSPSNSKKSQKSNKKSKDLDEESLGDRYYEQLMKEKGRVKSISKY